MKDKPCVSVIIPTYNRSKLLTKAIDSVLNQTYKNVEIIVIDDGSTDDTVEVLKPYMDKIRYLSGDHKGTANARNMGMKAATGKYIAFLDSDDLYLPYKLELQVDFIEKNPSVGMVCSEFSGLFEDGTSVEYLMRNYHYIWNRKKWHYESVFSERGTFANDTIGRPIDYYIGDIFQYILQDTLIPTNTILFDKKILGIVGYQNISYRFAQEYEFAVRICKYFRVAFLNVPTYILLFHSNQSTSFVTVDTKRSKEKILLEIEGQKVLLNAVMDWGYNDKEYYKKNKKLIDTRLAELHFIIGKNWLAYGNIQKARKCFSTGFRYDKRSIKLLAGAALSFMPATVGDYLLTNLSPGMKSLKNKFL